MTRSIFIAVLLFMLGAQTPALASGGGGGGSSLPSSSGPAYDPAAEYQKGIKAYQEGDFKAAEAAMKRVVRVVRKDANSHYILGLAHIGQMEYRPATRALGKAVKNNPDLYDAHAKLGVSYIQINKVEKANNVLAELAKAQTHCAQTCGNAGAIDQAIAEINAAKETGETTSSLLPTFKHASLQEGDVLYSNAVRLINLERYDTAIEELKAAERILGPHPDVLTYLGFASRKSGEGDIALQYYTTALAVDPAHLNANEYLGEFYLERGNLALARIQLEKLDMLCPFGCAQVEELRAWIYPNGI